MSSKILAKMDTVLNTLQNCGLTPDLILAHKVEFEHNQYVLYITISPKSDIELSSLPAEFADIKIKYLEEAAIH